MDTKSEMSNQETKALFCPGCGHSIVAGEPTCAHCNFDLNSTKSDDLKERITAWERESDRLKKLWVIVVVFFWFSASFQVALYFLEGDLNFVLLSVISGMMILGVVLKSRYQLHLRNKP